MTNFEKFKDVINESNGMFGVHKGAAVNCNTSELLCTECDFDMSKDCFPQRMKWCAEEYHEPEPEPEKEEPEKKCFDGRVLITADLSALPLLNALTDADKDTATVALTAVMSGIIGSLNLDFDEVIEKLNEMHEIIERKGEKWLSKQRHR